MSENEELLERLEAEAKLAAADVEELTVVAENEIERKNEQIEELRSEREEKEERIEELESEKEEKEEKLEELQEEVSEVAEVYAEELAESSPAFEQDELMERYDVSELRQKHENAVEEGVLDEMGSLTPAPKSGDSGGSPGVQEPDGNEADSGETEELSDTEKEAVETFRKKGGVWAEMAEEIEESD